MVPNVYAQATKSIPLGKKIGIDTRVPIQTNTAAVDRAVQQQLDQARRQAQAQENARRQQAKNRESLSLHKDDMSNENEYVATPQGDIRKGSWQACEYFYTWDKHQQKYNIALDQYQTQREMILLMFDISEDYCNVLAQQRKQAEELPLEFVPGRPNFAATSVPGTVQDQPIAHQPVAVQSSAQADVPTQQQETVSWAEYRKNETSSNWHVSPRKIKRYIKEYVAQNCTTLQESLELQTKKEYLRSRHRIALTGYHSLCQAYEQNLGQSAALCSQPLQCQQAPTKAKEEASFLAIYNEKAAKYK